MFIRINPMREGGAKNDDVTSYRQVLVEFDKNAKGERIPKDVQFGAIVSSGLPVSAVIDSGNKSIHAWVRVDAPDASEYKRRVDIIWDWFEGLNLDKQNKNPSRLSRCPEGWRMVEGERRQQTLLAVNVGAESWAEWESENAPDGLPKIVAGSEFMATPRPEPPQLIGGVLHQGCKMIIGGASKARKSWTLIDMMLAVSSGGPWWGFPTQRGRALYINFELPDFAFQHRLKAIAAAKGITDYAGFDLWNLRGYATDFSVLIPKILARIKDGRYALIILDPIYKGLGKRDENKAGDIASLCNEIEQLAVQSGAAVVFGAHYSKGNQAGKDAIDRIGGSGVFARDPDVILTMTPHEERDAYVVDLTLRALPQVDPFVVRWETVTFARDDRADASCIRKPGKSAKEPSKASYRRGSPYESANWSPRRGRVPGAAPGDAKRDLTPGIRNELVRRSRYLHKNSGFVRELVSNMAIYSTGDGIKPQAQSPDPVWNRRAEEYFANWAARCEVTGRFSFEECQSLVCRGIDIDGEYFIHKTRDAGSRPVLQLVEAHRVGDTAGSTETVDGIGMDTVGAPSFYRIILDDGLFRDLPAASVLHVFEPESASAVRHPATIQHSINHVLDEMELLALEKHAVKDNADVARILKTERGELDEESGDFSVGSQTAPADGSDPVSLQKIIGGKLVALKPNESLDSFQSNRPSPTFTGFLEFLRRDSALGVLPFEFAADSSKIGGAGVRLVVAKADRRFSFRQLILIQRFIRPVWAYVIGDAIATGVLPSVINWHKISATTPRRVSVDAGREAQQNRADVEMGLKTLSEHFAEQGMDFEEEMRVRAQNARRILDLAQEYKVPVEMLWQPAGGGLPILTGNELEK